MKYRIYRPPSFFRTLHPPLQRPNVSVLLPEIVLGNRVSPDIEKLCRGLNVLFVLLHGVRHVGFAALETR